MTSQPSSLAWLQRLRWLAICGQAATLAVAGGFLKLPIPWIPFALIFGTTVFTNIVLRSLPPETQQSERTAASVLFLDVILLTMLLRWSGGPENPFSILYLLHVVLAAVLLPPRWAGAMAAVSSALFASLFYPVPPAMPSHAAMHHTGPMSAHLVGMWAAFSIVAAISAYCVTRIADELRAREREHAGFLLNQHRLASLTTLAAGAAHELATPLGTLTVVVHEYRRRNLATLSEQAWREDLQLMEEQLKRCRDIIANMRGYSGELIGEEAELHDVRTILDLLSARAREQFGERVVVEPSMSGRVNVRLHSVVRSLISLVKNGVEATDGAATVRVSSSLEFDHWMVRIHDSGPVIPPDILLHFGDPFYTTKSARSGMGLGVFLARLTAESHAGSLTFESVPAQGTCVSFVLPLARAAEAPLLASCGGYVSRS